MKRSPYLSLLVSVVTSVTAFADDFVGKDLAGRDFSGQRLLKADFTGAKLAGARFPGAVLRGAVFDEADLTRADFRRADVRGASFRGAKGLEADPKAFRDALFSDRTVWPEGFAAEGAGAKRVEREAKEPAPAHEVIKVTENADTTATGDTPSPSPGAAPAGQPPSGIDHHGKSLVNADFKGQYLAQANFDGADLTSASFYQAKARGATFRGAKLAHVSFDGADLTGADFTDADLDRATFVGAKLSDAKLAGRTLHLAGWEGYFQPPSKELSWELREQITKAMAGYLHNHDLSFKGADLRRARLLGELETVDLRKADLRGADLGGTTKLEARFVKGATYDSGTRWPENFDPVAAGAVKGEDLAPAPVADVTEVTKAPAPESYGLAGYIWRVAMPDGGETRRLLFLYPDGSYSWSLGKEQYVDGTWRPGEAASRSIELEKGLDEETWVATDAGEGRLSLEGKTSKRRLTAERGDRTK